MIKHKVGACIDCVDGSAPKPLMAKRCINAPYYHYLKNREKIAKEKKKERDRLRTQQTAQNNNGKTLGSWFKDQISIMPLICENCDSFLNHGAIWGPQSYVAHIIPKKLFESVMVHPMNRLFLCIDCHTNYDRSTSDEIVKMKYWPLAIERFNSFKNLIDPSEVSKLQECFSSLM